MPLTHTQTQLGHSWRNRKIQHNVFFPFLIILLVVALSGCNQEEFDVLNVESALSALYFLPEDEHASILTLHFEVTSDDSVLEVQIATPDKNSRWVVSAKRGEDGRFTVGPLSMGKGNTLVTGMYSMVILNEKGKTIDHSFSVQPPSTSVDPYQWGSYEESERVLTLNRTAVLQVGNEHIDLAADKPFVIDPEYDEFYLSFANGSTIVRVTL